MHQRSTRGHGDPGTLRLSALGKTWHTFLGNLYFLIIFLHFLFLLGGNLLRTRRALFSSLSARSRPALGQQSEPGLVVTLLWGSFCFFFFLPPPPPPLLLLLLFVCLFNSHPAVYRKISRHLFVFRNIIIHEVLIKLNVYWFIVQITLSPCFVCFREGGREHIRMHVFCILIFFLL